MWESVRYEYGMSLETKKNTGTDLLRRGPMTVPTKEGGESRRVYSEVRLKVGGVESPLGVRRKIGNGTK